MKKIIIDIAPDGETHIEAEGFKGSTCNLATRELELVLAGGTQNVDKKPKPDFYGTVGQAGTIRQ